MRADRPTRLLVAAAVVVGAVLILAASRSGSADVAQPPLAATTTAPGRRLPTPTTTSTVASASASMPTNAPADELPEADVRPTTSLAPSTVADEAPVTGEAVSAIEPAALQAPTVGAYRERYEGPGGEGEGTLAVTRRGSSTTLRRRVEDSIASQTVRVDADGIQLLVTDDGGGPCRYEVAPLLVPSQLEVGRAWSSDAGCSTADGIHVQRVEEAEVTGKARTTVDGAPVDTWIIQRHIVETAEHDGVVVVSETVSSELLAPGVGLTVYRVARTDTPDPEGRIESTAVAIELLSTTPG